LVLTVWLWSIGEEDGVTVTVAITGEVVALVAVKLEISPDPLAARPIDVALLVQLNTASGTAPVKLTAVVEELLHTV